MTPNRAASDSTQSRQSATSSRDVSVTVFRSRPQHEHAIRRAYVRASVPDWARSTVALMEVYCADCGCLVERGLRVVPCGATQCCCRDLTLRDEHHEERAG